MSTLYYFPLVWQHSCLPVFLSVVEYWQEMYLLSIWITILHVQCICFIIYIILKYLHNLFLCPTRISIRFKALLYLQMTCNILLDLLFHISWMFAELDTCIVKAKCRSKCSYNVCLSYHSIFISLGNVRTNTPVNEITVLVTWLHYFPLIFLWLIFHNISNS